jgi:hypothetical protein
MPGKTPGEPFIRPRRLRRTAGFSSALGFLLKENASGHILGEMADKDKRRRSRN